MTLAGARVGVLYEPRPGRGLGNGVLGADARDRLAPNFRVGSGLRHLGEVRRGGGGGGNGVSDGILPSLSGRVVRFQGVACYSALFFLWLQFFV